MLCARQCRLSGARSCREPDADSAVYPTTAFAPEALASYRKRCVVLNGRVLFLGLIMLALAGCSHLGGGKLGGAAETGQASYYADKFEQRKTANGERYRHDALTAAHRTLPFGTRVQVTNLDNGRSVVVRINDRGPFVRGRVIDLSKSAFTRIGQVSSGLLPVKLVVLSLPPR